MKQIPELEYPSEEQLLSVAADVLGNRFGGNPELTDPEDLGGVSDALVMRVRVAPNPFVQQRSIVVKLMPPAQDGEVDAALLREIVSYQFVTSMPVDVRPGPELLAYDIDKRILILSDEGDAPTLAEICAKGDIDAEVSAFRSLGGALGRMHLGTAMREDDFNTLLRRMWSRTRVRSEESDLRDRSIVTAIKFGVSVCEEAGVTVPSGVQSLAADAAKRIATGTHRAFTPFDLAPDNILLARKVRFLDYDWAGFRDVLFDIATVIAGFPLHTSAVRPSAEATEAFIRAWSEEVRTVWYRALDERRMFSLIAAALVGWVLISASVIYFGSPQAALHCESSEAEPGEDSALSHSERSLRDLAMTAEALADFARRCDDSRADDAIDFAHNVVAFVEKALAGKDSANKPTLSIAPSQPIEIEE